MNSAVYTYDPPTFAVGAAGNLADGVSVLFRGMRNNKRRRQIVISNRHHDLNLRVRVVQSVPPEFTSPDGFHSLVFPGQNFTLFTDADIYIENASGATVGVGVLEIFYQ